MRSPRCRTRSWAPGSRAGARSFAAARTTACRSSTRSRRRSPSSRRRSSSTSRTSRCSGRASASGSQAGCSRSGSRTRAPTSASTRPRSQPFALPSLAVVGTGKRVGKTAVTGHLARLLARERDVVVVAMGRGGPPEPELAEARPSLERLLELSRSGRHAASDYLETAALAGVSDGRLPALRRRPRRSARASRTCSKAQRSRRSGARPRRLRRQRRGDPAGRGRRARARRERRAAGRRRDGLPERVPDPGLRPRRRHRWGQRTAARGDRRGQGRAGRAGRAAAPAGRAGLRPARRVLHDRAGLRARDARAHLAEQHGAEVVHVSRQPRPPRARCARSSSASTPTSTSSRSRRRRSTSSPRRALERGRERRVRGQRVVVGEPDLDELTCSRCARGRSAPGDASRRYRQPLPLGGEDGLPYSKGLMARALIAAGLSADRAYELALAVEADLAAAAAPATTLERLEELALETLGAGGRHARDAPPAPLPQPLRARPADHPARRRRDRAPASRRSRPRSPTGSGSPASPRPTSSARRCARSSRRSSCRRSTTRASRPAARSPTRTRTAARPSIDGFLEQTRNVLVGVRAAIDRALEEGWSMRARGRPPRPGDAPEDRGRARRPVRARDRGRGGAREPLLDPRQRLRGRAALREVPRRASTTSA